MSRLSIPVKELQPDFVVVEELRNGKTGGIVLSAPFAKASSDAKWGSEITNAFNRIQDTKLPFDPDEDFSKVAISTPANDARIEFTMRRDAVPVRPADDAGPASLGVKRHER